MGFSESLVIAICLTAPVFSMKYCKNIPGAPNFDFKKFIQYQYRYVLGTDTDEFRTYTSAKETNFKVEDKYYSVFTNNKLDGTQENVGYIIDTKDGADLYESVLINGYPSSLQYKVTIYAFKEGSYAQFYACGYTGTDKDIRYALLAGEQKLTKSLKKELLRNDARLGFNGKLTLIGEEKYDSRSSSSSSSGD